MMGRWLPNWVTPGVIRAAQFALAALLLALLWRTLDGQEAARSLASAEPAWLAAALGALTLQTGLSALRWRMTAAQLGIGLSRGEALREYYLGQALNLSLPGGMIGDAGRALRARGQAGLMASGQAVVFERLAGQGGLYLVTAGAFVLTLAVPGGVEWPRWLIPPLALFLLAGLALPVCLYGLARAPGRLGAAAATFWRDMHRALLAREVLLRQIGLSLATTLCNLAAFAFCAMAVGHGLPLAAVLAFVPLILMAMLIPLTVSGWGLREGAAAALFPLAGGVASGGLAASVAFGLVMIVATLPGLYFVLGRGPRGLRP
ncbi:lysylphosphatidylglycerol synthase transmembrane domain-containing protein [Roseovarius sp. D0-M9]|uniref:lysylphosphatidylglycerol synthase transmembrane domain-containing protein n=1 Tax=Roseovarius sp. D0-M9 TaxID=3127117 RepID=UPI0030104303